jgi:hypothetical protein
VKGVWTVDAIGEAVLRSRGGAHGSWPWTRKILARADEQFRGVWRATTITGAEALEILLPPHTGEPCKGDQLTLIGTHGATVRQAGEVLGRLGTAYARNNASCAERIGFAADAPFSPIVVCTAPLDWEEYARVAPVPGAYYCVDGLHRLLAWAAHGRLTAGKTIDIWLAG